MKHKAMKRLAIVGNHPTNRELIPWDDTDVEIWCFNEAPQKEWVKRWDAVFQLHPQDVYRSPNNFVNKEHWNWLQEARGKKIYMQSVDPLVPDSVRYPLEDVLKLPGGHHRWISSSPAYALALGLLLGYPIIEIYGVELSSNSEYAYQLNNWLFWEGVAEGMGREIRLFSGQVHFAGKLYGYEGQPTISQSYFQARADELKPIWRENEGGLRRLKQKLEKAYEKNEYDNVATLTMQMQDLMIASGQAAGAMGEAERHGKRTDTIPRQEYEHSAASAQQEGEDLKALMHHSAGKAEYVWNVWKQTGKAEALNQLRFFTKMQLQHAYDMGARHGIYQENLEYINELDARITALGGVRSLAALEDK
jgi:hypothetical protein